MEERIVKLRALQARIVQVQNETDKLDWSAEQSIYFKSLAESLQRNLMNAGNKLAAMAKILEQRMQRPSAEIRGHELSIMLTDDGDLDVARSE